MYDEIFGQIQNPDRWVYHYTSMKTALEFILPSGEIRFSPFNIVNDPRESKSWRFSVYSNNDNDLCINDFREINIKSTEYLKIKSKVLCLVRDEPKNLDKIDSLYRRGFSKPRMWAQYSDDHSGVCIVLDKERLKSIITSTFRNKGKLYFGNIEYENFFSQIGEIKAFQLNYQDIIKNSLENVIDNMIVNYHKNYFFTKCEDWSTENEWRAVAICNENGYEYVPIKEAICGLVLGVNYSPVYESCILPFGKKYSVPVARIDWHNGKPGIINISA